MPVRPNTDVYVVVKVDSDPTVYGSLNAGIVACDGARRTLTSVFAVVPNLAAGPHTIFFKAGPNVHYDSADRWNVTLLGYSQP